LSSIEQNTTWRWRRREFGRPIIPRLKNSPQITFCFLHQRKRC